MPFDLQYNTSFTGGSPYELGRAEHGYAQDDEEERLRRQIELEAAQGQIARYGDSVKQMAQERALRLGYGSMEQKIADPYSDLYRWSPQPAMGSPAGMVNIGMQDPSGAMVETLRRPMLRTIDPGASERVSLMREATRSGSALTPEEIAERESIKAEQAIRVATERDRLLAARQNQAQRIGTLRTSANIQAGAKGSDREAIARDLETSSTAAMPSADPLAAGPDLAAEKAKAGAVDAARQKEIEDTFKAYRERGWTDAQITAKLKKLGYM